MEMLFDTDICIQLLRGDPKVIDKTRKISPSKIAVSVITQFELLYGILRCPPNHQNKEKAKVSKFLEMIQVIPFDDKAANKAAEFRSMLAKSGTPIGPYDLLIAATAETNSLTLITNNQKEFSRITSLESISWA